MNNDLLTILCQYLNDKQLNPPSNFLNSETSKVLTKNSAFSTSFIVFGNPFGIMTVPFTEIELAAYPSPDPVVIIVNSLKQLLFIISESINI